MSAQLIATLIGFGLVGVLSYWIGHVRGEDELNATFESGKTFGWYGGWEDGYMDAEADYGEFGVSFREFGPPYRTDLSTLSNPADEYVAAHVAMNEAFELQLDLDDVDIHEVLNLNRPEETFVAHPYATETILDAMDSGDHEELNRLGVHNAYSSIPASAIYISNGVQYQPED